MTLLDRNGEVQAVLELERLFELRYYALNNNDTVKMEAGFLWAYSELLRQAGIPTRVTLSHAVCVVPAMDTAMDRDRLKRVMKKYVRCESWNETGHHEAHAIQAFYDSPLRTALIFSYDGGGDENQNFEVFLADRRFKTMERIKIFRLNLGYVYMQIATHLSEVTHNAKRNATAPALHLSGRMMGYVALGKVRESWVAPLELIFRGRKMHDPAIGKILSEDPTIQDERDLAATAQMVFENILIEVFDEYISMFPSVGGIVVAGGCALNVLSNRKLQKRFQVPLHVSPSPNDGGLSLGAAQLVTPPLRTLETRTEDGRILHSLPNVPVVYGGPDLFDIQDVPKYVEKAGGDGARKVTVDELAELLNEGKIIALVRGRSEFGPRALGHRSLIAVPHLDNMKKRLNRLKYREWWRPVAPMVTTEEARRLFVGPSLWSPYMTFAAEIKEEFRKSLPAIVHFDGTARLQTVERKKNEWLWRLLEAVKKKTGKGVLCNTSFNTRGKPILNRMREAMKMLFELPDLNYVLVGDVLFSKLGAERTQRLWRRHQSVSIVYPREASVVDLGKRLRVVVQTDQEELNALNAPLHPPRSFVCVQGRNLWNNTHMNVAKMCQRARPAGSPSEYLFETNIEANLLYLEASIITEKSEDTESPKNTSITNVTVDRDCANVLVLYYDSPNRDFVHRHRAIWIGAQRNAIVLATLLAPKKGLVLEFGVGWGGTTNIFGELLAEEGRQVHGFDSFAGLPEAWYGSYEAGSLSTQGRTPQVEDNVRLYPGWFNESLLDFLSPDGTTVHMHKNVYGVENNHNVMQAVALIHFDADIYSSTFDVLSLLVCRLRVGTIMLFDELLGYKIWADHEWKALQDASAKFGFAFEVVAFTEQQVVTIVTKAANLRMCPTELINDVGFQATTMTSLATGLLATRKTPPQLSSPSSFSPFSLPAQITAITKSSSVDTNVMLSVEMFLPVGGEEVKICTSYGLRALRWRCMRIPTIAGVEFNATHRHVVVNELAADSRYVHAAACVRMFLLQASDHSVASREFSFLIEPSAPPSDVGVGQDRCVQHMFPEPCSTGPSESSLWKLLAAASEQMVAPA